MQIKWNMHTKTKDLEAVAIIFIEFNFSELSKFAQRYIASVDTWNDTNHTTVIIEDISDGELINEIVVELGSFPTLTEGMVAAHALIERNNDNTLQTIERALGLGSNVDFELEGDMF